MGRTLATPAHLLQHKQHDYNALSPANRQYFSYIRGLAINMIPWLDCHYAGNEKEDIIHTVAEIPRTLLHQQVQTILIQNYCGERQYLGCSQLHIRGPA